ncbi:MAG: methionine gamma-lyase family protein [Clostridia bacterium]|nr:methionine gamma-lyase family protein [Clostridia bacterium]MDE7328699.1 methionine gamma-lyase family protein [Clostridia bacterium]
MNFNQETLNIVNNAQSKLKKQFEDIDDIATYNQMKVLKAFQDNNVGQRHLAQTNGYGYDDIGRDTLCKLFAEVFGGESAIVSPLIVSGTHALTLALCGVLRPGDEMLAITGSPYDTLKEVILGEGNGSLKDFGISYAQVDLNQGKIDLQKVVENINARTKLIFIGRSRGYEWRDALSIPDIKAAVEGIRKINKDICIMVDNCYGEFLDKQEPLDVGVDMIAGSLIKNPGGGIAPTGGYVCGKKKYIDMVANRLTAPSIGMEVGSYSYGYKDFYQGFFLAPHTVANALKGSILFGQVFSDLGFETMPKSGERCNDIIRSIKFDTKDELIEFCRAIQEASPIDSNVVPYPWDMPGYEHEVIMAAGTFVAGASIELSADSPIKEPYIAYLQGGLTYEHVKIAAMYCVEKLSKLK